MENIKEVSIKNRTYYFFDDMINIKNFALSLLKISKKNYKNVGIYNIVYITMKDSDHINTHSVNPLYFNIGEAEGSIEEKNGNKYLIFVSSDKNKEVLKKYREIWDKIKKLISKTDNKLGIRKILYGISKRLHENQIQFR